MPTEYVIIIPHFNQEKQLGKCLKALRQNGYLDGEVLIVDNKSDNLPRAIADKYGVRLLCTETAGSPYVARNLGIAESQAEYIVLLDVNCEVKQDCIENALKEVDERTIASAMPTYRNKSTMTSWQKFDYLYSIIRSEDMEEKESLPATNLYFTRSAFHKIGPFQEVRSLGDIAWTRKAYSMGFNLKLCEEAQFYYPFKDRAAFIRKYKRLGGGEVETGKVRSLPWYFIKNILPPSGKYVSRFLYLNSREQMGLHFLQVIFFCWIVKILYAIGSVKKYGEE